MSADLFDLGAEALERHTDFDRLEARGTLRIALKNAGLNPKNVSADQFRVVFEKVMPAELEQRGIEDSAGVISRVMDEIAASATDTTSAPSSDEIVSRGSDQMTGSDAPHTWWRTRPLEIEKERKTMPETVQLKHVEPKKQSEPASDCPSTKGYSTSVISSV